MAAGSVLMYLPGQPAGLFTEENKVGQNTAQPVTVGLTA